MKNNTENSYPDHCVPDSVHLELSPCPSGCEAQDRLLFVAKDRLHNLPGEFKIVQCSQCRLIRTNPRPTPDTIGYYYPPNYGPYLGTRVTEGSATRRATIWRRVISSLLRVDNQKLPKLTPGRLLEVGCASGAFLHQMANKGWKVEGLEFSDEAASAARSLGYSVQTGTIEQAPDPSHLYDLVVGWMVLEHLHDPVLALSKLHRWVKPGGWLAISVPNAASLEFRLFRDAWYALQAPTHLYHFTPATLYTILERGGWRMEKVFHQRTLSNLIASAGYRLSDIKLLPPVVHEQFLHFPNKGLVPQLAAYPLAFLMSLFGQTGRMTVWARRIDEYDVLDE